MHERISLDRGEALLQRVFSSVIRHDFVSRLLLPDPEPLVAYVRSMSEAVRLPDPGPFIAAVTSMLTKRPGAAFQVTAHSGCLVCT